MIEFLCVNKHFGSQDVLIDVSFRVMPGEKMGITGPNGSGKSTLFKLITGEESPHSGDVSTPARCRVGYLRQQLHAYDFGGFLLDYTMRAIPELETIHHEIVNTESQLQSCENEDREKLLDKLGRLQTRYETLGGYEIETRAEAALCGLGFRADQLSEPFSTFSGGWQMRAELARTLISQPDILLLDEPSNYLDLPAVEWIQRTLRSFQGTLLLISHDRYLLESLTTITLELANGRATRYEGNYRYYLRERENRYEQQQAAAKNQERRKQEIERFVERFRAKNTKASQVQSRIKMLEKMEDIPEPLRDNAAARIRLAPAPHSGAEIVRLEDAGLTYDGQKWIVRGVNLSIQRGDKIALVGYNGMGKTTLLRLLAGKLSPSEGRRKLGHKVVVGYQSQEFAETMPPGQTAFRIARDVDPEMSDGEVRGLLGGFGFSGDAIDKPCKVLSGGEKIRLAFAKIFAASPNFLLLDEPTTHLDLQGRRALEQALRDYSGTVCLVSHDVEFVRHVAEHIVAMTPPGITQYHGGYDYYREKAGPLHEKPASAARRKPSSRKEDKRLRAEKRQEQSKRKRQLKKQVRSAEQRIETLESEQKELLAKLAENADDLDFKTLNQRLTNVQVEISAATTEWESAAMELEALTDGG